MLKLRHAALMLLALPGACATVNSNACPPLKPYDTATQLRAADDLERLPPGSPVPGMIGDYGLLREQCRVGSKT